LLSPDRCNELDGKSTPIASSDSRTKKEIIKMTERKERKINEKRRQFIDSQLKTVADCFPFAGCPCKISLKVCFSVIDARGASARRQKDR
jgi:hypothetical protein